MKNDLETKCKRHGKKKAWNNKINMNVRIHKGMEHSPLKGMA